MKFQITNSQNYWDNRLSQQKSETGYWNSTIQENISKSESEISQIFHPMNAPKNIDLLKMTSI